MSQDLFQVNLLSNEEMESALSDEPIVTKKEEQPAQKAEEENKSKPIPPEQEKKLIAEVPVVEIEGDDEDEENVELSTETEEKKEKLSKKDIASSLNYKALAEYYIEKGDWVKPDNWDEVKDEVEWDAEFYADFQTQQFNAKVKAAIEEETSQFSPDYKALLEYAKEGGNIQNLLPSIQQQIEVSQLNPANQDDAEKILRIECEAKGWSEKRTNTYIESLKDKGDSEEFSAFAKEAQDSLVESIEEQRQEEIAAQKARQEAAKAAKASQVKRVKEELQKLNVPDREKKELDEFWTKPKYQTETGHKYTEFDKISYEINSDPVKYAAYINMLKNFDKLIKNTPETEKEIKKKTFEFLLTGQKDLGKNNSQQPSSEKKSRQKGQFNPFQIGGV